MDLGAAAVAVAPSRRPGCSPAAAHHGPGPVGRRRTAPAGRPAPADVHRLPVALPGVEVRRNDYAWARSRWPAPEVKPTPPIWSGPRWWRPGWCRPSATGSGRAVADRALPGRPLLRAPQGDRAEAGPDRRARGRGRPPRPAAGAGRPPGSGGAYGAQLSVHGGAHPAAGAGRDRRRGAGLRHPARLVRAGGHRPGRRLPGPGDQHRPSSSTAWPRWPARLPPMSNAPGRRRDPGPRWVERRAGQEPAPGGRPEPGRSGPSTPASPRPRSTPSTSAPTTPRSRRPPGRPAAEVVDRPADLSGDTASSESALLHALDTLAADGADPEIVVFVQCTSPFIDPGRPGPRGRPGDRRPGRLGLRGGADV